LNKICWIFLIATLTTLSTHATEVYRWIDKNGNVHYADKSPNVNADRITIKPGLYNEYLKTQEDLVERARVDNDENEGQVVDNAELPAEVDDSKTTMESCGDINKALKQNEKDLKSSEYDVYRAAKSSIKRNEKLLKRYRCK
jgi:hypothetical protein